MKITIIGYLIDETEWTQRDYENCTIQEAVDRYCDEAVMAEVAISVFFENEVKS